MITALLILKLIAETFNEYFVSIALSLASETSEDLRTEHSMTSHPNSNPMVGTIFHFHHININDNDNDIILALIITNLKVNKSTGLDKIPANVLRLSACIIAPSLTYIFNLSLDTAYFDDGKRARAIPIYTNLKIDGSAKTIDQFLYFPL